MKFFKRHPEMLLELMPDGVNLQVAPTNQKSLSKRGQCMIPELGIVPPQSGLFGLNTSSNHNRKKSHGDLRHMNNSFNRQSLNPTVAKFSNPSNFAQKVNNTPSDGSNLNSAKNYFKPSTANEYHTPNFIGDKQIVGAANKTVYKVRLAT